MSKEEIIEYLYDIHCHADYTIEDIAEELSAQKHGKWIKPTGMMPPEYHGRYECSECGFWAMREWLHYRMELTNYCPQCGCKMVCEEE